MTVADAQIVLDMDGETDSFYRYEPRPDDHQLFDQQTSFLDDKLMGTAWLLGGNGSGTTETAMRKLARFVLETPPPRPRTPFWIIGETYEQICSMWDEKLSPTGHAHIPESEIDRPNIAWYKPNRNWPFSVPMKARANGNSWTLVFKSYEQGRQKMQAQAIGGFCFVEQFPWGIYTEVMRGCREYSFPGSKMCEFTPIDPEMSYDLEVMIEEDTLPAGDRVYYLNTDCALAAGHVTQTWYDSFYGIVNDDMQDVRKRGLFATYEGLIYKGFNQFVHLVGDDECFPGGEFPLNVQYRRAIDWGAGIENAQVCLWGYYNSFGEWYIYDEYWSTDQDTTVNQHLKSIYDRWQWPHNNPAFGMSYADPSSKDCIRIASRFSTVYPECDDFSMIGANNAVIEGIDWVKLLLQSQPSTGRPRLFIHKGNCPNLTREMRTYRWLKGMDKGRNPRQARAEPLKKDDHACTISSMPVLTNMGWKPIIDVRTGDIVYSHSGWTDVLCGATKTGSEQPLVKVSVQNGQELICTPDHEFQTTDGMIPASQLQGRCLVRLSAGSLEQDRRLRQLTTLGSLGDDTLNPSTHPRDTFRSALVQTALPSTFTDEYIRTTSEKSLPEFTSTTRMRICETTTRLILSFAQTPSISETIIPQQLKPCKTKPSSGAGTIQLRHQRQPKLPAMLIGRNPLPSNCDAISAEMNSSRKMFGQTARDIAANDAELNQERLCKSNAQLAESRSWSIPQSPVSFAAVDALRVVSVSPAGSDDTYCIATASGTMVWDGGVVVSNCDALRYLTFTESNTTGSVAKSFKRSSPQIQKSVRLDVQGSRGRMRR